MPEWASDTIVKRAAANYASVCIRVGVVRRDNAMLLHRRPAVQVSRREQRATRLRLMRAVAERAGRSDRMTRFAKCRWNCV